MRAPGGDIPPVRLPRGDYNRGENLPQQVADLFGLMHGTLPADRRARGVLLQLQVATRPQLWMLGSSEFGGLLAAQLGICGARAHFINAHFGHQSRATAVSRAASLKRGNVKQSYLAAAVFVICRQTLNKEAADLAKAVDSASRANGLWFERYRFRISNRAPRSSTASANSPGDRRARKRRSIIGTPDA